MESRGSLERCAWSYGHPLPSYGPRPCPTLWTSGQFTTPVDVRRVSEARDTPLDGAEGTTQRSRRHNSTSSSLQVGQLGPDAQLGRAPEHGVDVGVHLLDDPARELRLGRVLGVRLRRELSERGLDLLQA